MEEKKRKRKNWNIVLFTMPVLTVVAVLLSGCQGNKPYYNKNIREIDAKLIEAASKGNLEQVNILLKKGADVNRQGTSNSGKTALCSAAYHNHREVVKILLEFNADIEKGNIYGNTPLMIAAEEGNIDIVNILLEAKANVNTKSHYGRTALMSAVEHPEIVKVLLNAKAEVNVKDGDGNTALMGAALFDETKSVKLLLKAKADANTRFSNTFWLTLFAPHPDTEKIRGNTPLIFAASRGNKEMVKALLDAKANINAKNRYGQTALMKATDNGYTEIINLLKEY